MARLERRAVAVAFACAMTASSPAFGATLSFQVTDAAGAALADAAVYVVPVSGKGPSAPAKAIIDQVRREFTPLVSVMQTGTVVSFPNSDNIRHQVYSFSPAKTFELRLYSGTQAPPVTFDKPGVVTLGCNIHDHMIAYALVVDTPWFGKSDGSGAVRLDQVPAGEYVLHAWHPRLAAPAPVTQKLGVKADVSSTIRLELKPGDKAGRHH